MDLLCTPTFGPADIHFARKKLGNIPSAKA